MAKSGGYGNSEEEQHLAHKGYTVIKQKLAIPILLSIEEGFTHSVTSQSDT